MKSEGHIGDFFKSRRRKAIEDAEILKEARKKANFEKGDFSALIIAALTTIAPVVIVVLLIYYLITILIFG